MSKCVCTAVLINGKCPHGCERFRKPHQRLQREQAQTRRAVRKADPPIGLYHGYACGKVPWRRKKRAR